MRSEDYLLTAWMVCIATWGVDIAAWMIEPVRFLAVPIIFIGIPIFIALGVYAVKLQDREYRQQRL